MNKKERTYALDGVKFYFAVARPEDGEIWVQCTAVDARNEDKRVSFGDKLSSFDEEVDKIHA